MSAITNSQENLPLMEEFYTIQGEGFHTGKAAWFIRIGGCDVGCHWCDVKESWDASLHPLTAVTTIVEHASQAPAKAVVVTGGEPTAYDLTLLTKLLKEKGISTYLETSGAYPITGVWDWICLSPKKTQPPLQENYAKANELKVIVHNKHDLVWAEEQAEKVGGRQSAVGGNSLDRISSAGNCLLFLQPEWSKRTEMMPLITDYVMQHPKWSVSLQTHKYLGIP
jgi:7-carboxy-7-deazaguanine synthase